MLGDTLIELVVVNNLIRNGYQVDVYGDYAYVLRNWFPTMRIHSCVPVEENKRYSKYTTVLCMCRREISQILETWHPHAVALSHKPLKRFLMPEVDIHVMICKYQLGLSNVVRKNNIQPLSGLIERKYKNRVIIHPTSSFPMKNWLPHKYIELASRLHSDGYTPDFIVSENDKEEWSRLIDNKFPLQVFSSLSDVASYLYESGYFIGNDSGIGHLASNVKLPTLTLFSRKGIATHWRPAWAPSEVVLPPAWLNPRPIRDKFWKYFTSVDMVYAGFKRLVQNQN